MIGDAIWRTTKKNLHSHIEYFVLNKIVIVEKKKKKKKKKKKQPNSAFCIIQNGWGLKKKVGVRAVDVGLFIASSA
jgi:hypothetical protein